MFRHTSDEVYARRSTAGVRHLFSLGSFTFQDAMDGNGALRHFVVERGDPGGEPAPYEADLATMYEMVARFLAGEFEKREYRLEQSPAHHELLDILEMAAARARSGDPTFSLAELEEEMLDDEAPLDE